MARGPRLPGSPPARERVALLLRRAAGPLGAGEIVARTGLARSAVHTALAALEAEGRATRHPPPQGMYGVRWSWRGDAADAAD